MVRTSDAVGVVLLEQVVQQVAGPAAGPRRGGSMASIALGALGQHLPRHVAERTATWLCPKSMPATSPAPRASRTVVPTATGAGARW